MARTFKQIAEEAYRFVPIYGNGGQCGEDHRMKLVQELAEALDRLEHNMAQMLSDLAIDRPAHDISAALGALRAEVPSDARP